MELNCSLGLCPSTIGTLSVILAEPDNELKLESVLLSERAEESEEVERRRDRGLRGDLQGYLGSSVISFKLVSDCGRGVVERWDPM